MIISDSDNEDDDDANANDIGVVFAADSTGIAYPLYIVKLCMWVSKWVCLLLIISRDTYDLPPQMTCFIAAQYWECMVPASLALDGISDGSAEVCQSHIP